MASICKRRLAAPDIERKLEARIGIEPMHKDFADPRLTTWLPRHSSRGKDSGGWAGCQPGRGGENRVDGTPMVVIHPSGLIASGRGVAQTGSAFAWGAKGPGFKSRRPDHSSPMSCANSGGEIFSKVAIGWRLKCRLGVGALVKRRRFVKDFGERWRLDAIIRRRFGLAADGFLWRRWNDFTHDRNGFDMGLVVVGDVPGGRMYVRMAH